MKKYGLFAALAALAALIAVYIVLSGTKKTAKPRDVIVPFTADEIKSISYTPYGGDEVSFYRDQGIWRFTGDDETRADQTKVSVLAASVTGIGISRIFSTDDPLSDFGLDEPAYTVNVTSMKGGSVSLKTGDINSVTGDVYCMIDGDDDICAVSSGLTVCFDQERDYYISEDDAASFAESAVSAEDIQVISGEEAPLEQ